MVGLDVSCAVGSRDGEEILDAMTRVRVTVLESARAWRAYRPESTTRPACTSCPLREMPVRGECSTRSTEIADSGRTVMARRSAPLATSHELSPGPDDHQTNRDPEAEHEHRGIERLRR